MDVVRNSQRERVNNSTTFKPSSTRKVQVLYYLSRNGLLEHPHFLELTLLPNQPLRLKDVFDRLMALRGSGMPLQYSWSSKRNYKSGYVWHDLALKDIIHPAEGGEYVLKGSELVVQGISSERFQQVNLSNKQPNAMHQQSEANYNYNNSKMITKAYSGSQQQQKEGDEYEEQYEEEQEQEQEKEYEDGDGEKASYTSSTTTPHSRCSRGVSTEELLPDDEHHNHQIQNNAPKLVATTNHHSPRGHALPPSTLAEKLNHRDRLRCDYPKRFGDGTDSGTPSRYSVLLQLISCGSSGAEFKPRLSNVGTTKQREKSFSSPEENPRMMFGNVQAAEEKEYFSGSLVESIKANRVAMDAEPVLKRSNSYNEERKSKLGMEEVKVKQKRENNKVGGVKEKCIPIKKSPKESRK